MAIIEFRGGPITHKHLMGKRKDDLARMYIELLGTVTTLHARVEKYAHHLGMCISHGGHDCDCGKDEVLADAKAWRKNG